MKLYRYLMFIIGASFVLILAGQTSVASASTYGFSAGRIIDDGIFVNSTSMSVSQIQAFLNSKLSVCDTWGQQPYAGTTRAAYALSRGVSTPFVCLKDYSEGGKSSAQIIYDVAQKYSINPQVLIVLLQKEQALVTDDWPWPIQYRTATGYGCPDTAPCASEYFGLTNQLDWAAKMFRAIMNNSPTWYTPYVLGDNYIQYSPDASCGGSIVNIQNRATQALYNYTPYQPNQGALNAGWGTAYCGAYGNRNFYLYFTSWFGSINGGEVFSYDLQMASPIVLNPANPRAGELTTATFSVKNTSNYRVNYGSNLLQCRDGSSGNCDSNSMPAGSIGAGETKEFSYSVTPKIGGKVTLKPFFVTANGVWNRYMPSQTGINSEISFSAPHLRATNGMSINYNHPNVGETLNITVPIVNNGVQPISISSSLVQCRLNGVTNCDSPSGGADTIHPGQSKTYRYSIPIETAGNYQLIPYFRFENKWYNLINLDSRMNMVATDITAEQTFASDVSNPITGQPFNVSFSLKNNGEQPVDLESTISQCRFNDSTNCDPGFTDPLTLQPGSSKNYSDSFISNVAGKYRFVPYYKINGEFHTPRTSSALFIPVTKYSADMRIMDLSIPTVYTGDNFDVSYTVRNFGTKTAYYTTAILQCRYNSLTNCDSNYYGKLSIAPGESRTFTDQLSVNSMPGSYIIRPYFFQNGSWHEYKTSNGSVFSPRTVNVTNFTPNISIDELIALSNNNPTAGSTQTVKYEITNNSNRPVNISRWVTQCRVNGTNCDSPTNANGEAFSLEAGEKKLIETSHQLNQSGTYTMVPYFTYDNTWYRYSGFSSRVFTVN